MLSQFYNMGSVVWLVIVPNRGNGTGFLLVGPIFDDILLSVYSGPR